MLMLKVEGGYPLERYETGLWSLDRALSVTNKDGKVEKGFPMGIVEIFGSKGTGKSTFVTSIGGIVAQSLKKDIVYAPVELIDSDFVERTLESVGFEGLVSIISDKKIVSKFLPDIKFGKDDVVTDEILGDSFVEALRWNSYGVGIFDSLTAVSPVEEMQSSSADKNMGRRARLSGVWVRQILQSSRFRENGFVPLVFFITHKSTIMSMYPTNTGTPTSGGEAKKNLAKLRIGLKKINDEAFAESNAYIVEGITEHNNFGREKQKFWCVVLGGKGIHKGLSAVWDCKMLKIATFGKSVSLGGEKYGNIRTLIEKAHNGEDEVFQPFIEALKNPAKFSKVSAEDEDEHIEEPAE